MKNGLFLTVFALSLIVCCGIANTVGALAAEDDSAEREEAIRLLQSATTQSALGENVRAEERCRELLASPKLLKHVDAVQVRLLLASLLKKQDRNRDAYDLLVETLKKQREEVGDDDASIEDTMRAFGGLVINLTWSKAIKIDLPKEDYAEPTTLAKEAAALDIPHGHWSLALLQLRQGDKTCLDTMSRSLASKRGHWLGEFGILAMAFAQNGKQQLARDAHAAVCDRGAKNPNLYFAIGMVRDQAGETLGQNTEDVLEDMSRSDLVNAYSRLIVAYPDVARLRAWRASHLECLGRFEEAVADLQKATELSPTNWRYAEALATLRVFMADRDEQTKVCKDFMNACLVEKQYGELGGGGGGMDLVLLCSLAQDADVDRKKILGHAEESLETTPSRPFLELAHGMALYRTGSYEQALDVLPGADANSGSGKDRGLPIIFRAMALQKLGEKRAAKIHLKDAEEYFNSLFGGERVVRMRYQDAGTHYCMLTMGLREAKALINPDQE